MTLFEYNKKVQPGRRVFVMVGREIKVYGNACTIGSPNGTVEPGIRFDSGQVVKVTEGTAHLVQLEEAN